MTKYDYDDNGIARVFDEGKWYLIDRDERRVSDGYTYIEEWGEGYYKAELGAKKNILRPDGSTVLRVWHNDVYKVKYGFFVFSNTIRKSKTNPKTRYTCGVAHVNGDIIFPMIFDRARWMEDKDFIYAEIEEKPYLITTDGTVYDVAESHLPKKATADIKDFIEVEDNFPYTGVEGTVCEGCIYADGIRGKGEGCGRLFAKSFRNRYLKGRCEYRKEDLFEPSLFEALDQYRKEKAKEKEEKSSDVYALRIVKDFIKERLDGDIDKLRDLDLETLKGDEKYGQDFGPKSELAKSIMALVFGNAWPNLSVDSINRYEYSGSQMIHYQNLFGSNILDQYFKGMEKFNPSKEQFERALRVAHLINSIGNFWVLPNKLNDKESMATYKDNPKFRGYMDRYLQAMCGVFMDKKNPDMHLKGIFYKNRKVMTEYQGAEGWTRFVDNMMLQDFVDGSGKPKEIFDYIWSYMKDLDRESYFKSVDKFCTFCEETIPKRADQIISVLKTIIE